MCNWAFPALCLQHKFFRTYSLVKCVAVESFVNMGVMELKGTHNKLKITNIACAPSNKTQFQKYPLCFLLPLKLFFYGNTFIHSFSRFLLIFRCRESVSIYFAPESDLRVKSYDH